MAKLSKNYIISKIKKYPKYVVFSLAFVLIWAGASVGYMYKLTTYQLYITSTSMEPSFPSGSLVFADPLERTKSIDRGNVVIAKDSRDTNNLIIRRIVGLPGEKIKLKDGKIFIQPANSKQYFQLNESGYLSEHVKTYKSVLDPKMESDEGVVPNNSFYVLSDNRYQLSEASQIYGNKALDFVDSRTKGPVSFNNIVAIVRFGW